MSGPAGRIEYDDPGDVWFFAYGSLMWDPGFAHDEARPVLLRGYHRAFCVLSEVYRGTRESPGLTLGLDRGGSCRGRAFRVPEARRDEAARYLEERELADDIYFCRRVPVASAEGRFDAYAFVVNRRHAIYAPPRPLDDMARIIAACAGERGTNRDYLANTVEHLDALGIDDGPLHELLRRVRRLGP